jgi:hypothetical protein
MLFLFPDAGAVSAEIHALAKADQMDRASAAAYFEHQKEAAPRDRARLFRARQIVVNAGRLSPQDLDSLALIFQHGERPEDFEVARELSIMAFARGKFGSMPALAEDRFLAAIGKKQRFGSQFSWSAENRPVWKDLASEDAYSITDALRLDFLQPPLSAIKKRGLQAFQQPDDRMFDRLMQSRDSKWQSIANSRALWSWFRKRKPSRFSPSDLKKILALYRADKLRAPRDVYVAASVLGSFQTEPSLLLANELAAYSLCRGYAPARSVFARTWDRLFAIWGRRPRFGTIRGMAPCAAPIVNGFFLQR